MNDDRDRKFDPANPAHQRIWNDSAEGAEITPADPVRHSPMMIGILLRFGVDAYRAALRRRRSLRRRGG